MPGAAIVFAQLLALIALGFVAETKSAQPVFDFQYFKTEPDLKSPIIHILNRTKDESLLTPGYIFIDTVSHEEDADRLLSPLIYDDNGTLIFNGVKLLNSPLQRAQNSHVCDYLGERGVHLCVSEVVKNEVPIRATNRVFDNTYRSIANYSNIGVFSHPNQHEFKDTDNGNTYVQTIYPRRKENLRPLGGTKKARVVDSCIQEVDAQTKKELFRWCVLDHFKAKHSGNTISEAAQKAMNKKHGKGWDTVHMNAIDKNEEGDFIASIRYYDLLVKVAGRNAKEVHGVRPGKILWKLGASLSDFKFDNAQDVFKRQHDVRFISTGAEETVLSVHDNHDSEDSEGNKIQPCKAKIIVVNNKTMTARIDKAYRFPEHLGCVAMGSARKQDNGNMFVGWGKRPFFSEFSENGAVLLHAQFTKPSVHDVYNYRSLKFPWTGKPHWSPKLLAYSKCCKCKMTCYVSWNGATEVDSWRFYISTADPTIGPWIPILGRFKSTGFETKVQLPTPLNAFLPYVSAEALDASGNVLGSVYNSTFVPNPTLRDRTCNDEECFEPLNFDYGRRWDTAYRCNASLLPQLIVLAIVVVGFESLSYLANKVWDVAIIRYLALQPLVEKSPLLRSSVKDG